MRKVAIITAHDAPYQELADLTLPSLVAYAKRHNYDLYYQNDIEDDEKDACKARIFRELFFSGKYGPDDLCLWIDTDAVVLNDDIRVEDVWDRHADPGTHFLWAYDFNGPNSGVWIARFSDFAENYIRVCLYEQFAMGWGDNNPMNQKMRLPPFVDEVKCIAGIHMNSYPYEEHGLQDRTREWRRARNGYEPGDWILHGAGLEGQRRMVVLRKYLHDKHLDERLPATTVAPELRTPKMGWPILRDNGSDRDVWKAVVGWNEYRIGRFLPDDVVLDLGASTGPFTCLAYAHGARHIQAYEMDADSFAVAVQNVASMNGGVMELEHVVMRNVAVIGSGEGLTKKRSYVPGGMHVLDDGRGVPCETLEFNDILRPLDRVRLLKIDVEGSEWEIFYTCMHMDKIQEIVGEYHPMDGVPGADPVYFEDWLKRQGFKTEFKVKPGIGDFHAWR